jgi:penicillin-binding protein 1A
MSAKWWNEEDRENLRDPDEEPLRTEETIIEENDDDDGDEPGKPRRIWLWTTLALVLLGLGWFWYEIAKGLPTLEQLENPHPEMATRIISADGEPIDQYYIKNRTTLRLKDVPQHLIDALVATEDRSFYDHWGFDMSRFLKAIWVDVVTLSPRQGASTITQQLARNLYFSQEKTILRKVREAISAIQIEKTHTKKEILQMYLNVNYWGRGAYGLQVASQLYFGKDPKQLTVAEAAYLVGILKGPENYDPDDNYERAIDRRNLVLNSMVEAGYLDAASAERHKRQPIKTVPMKGYQGIAPHFVEMIRQELSRKPELQGHDLYRDGLVVYTTLNADLQRAANRAVLEHVEPYQKNIVNKRWNWTAHKGLLDTIISKAIRGHVDYRTAADENEKKDVAKRLRANTKFVDSVKLAEIRMQTGFVALDHTTGGILALVGSANFRESRYGLNHVTQIARQPGSSFKPVIYASAFEHGSSPETMVSNEPINMPDGDRVWSPGNFEGEGVGGMVSIKGALQHSVNLAAIHTMLEKTSIQDVIRTAKRMGIKSPIGAYPSIALGVAEVSPLELTSAYGIFANEGIRAEPYAIVRVEDRHGKVLYRAKPQFENVFEPRVARMMTYCLQSVVDAGTAVRIRSMFNFPAAGKTGTTQNYADAWFIGYTPHYTAGVWVGFDDKRVQFSGADGQGGRAAAPIWGRFMKYAYESQKPKISYFMTNWNAMPGQQPDMRSSNPLDSDLPRIPETYTPRNADPGLTDEPRKQPTLPPMQPQQVPPANDETNAYPGTNDPGVINGNNGAELPKTNNGNNGRGRGNGNGRNRTNDQNPVPSRETAATPQQSSQPVANDPVKTETTTPPVQQSAPSTTTQSESSPPPASAGEKKEQ